MLELPESKASNSYLPLYQHVLVQTTLSLSEIPHPTLFRIQSTQRKNPATAFKMSETTADVPMKQFSASPEEHEEEQQIKTEGQTSSGLSAAAQPFQPSGARPVKSMPAKGKTLKGSNSYLPVQAKVPKTAEEKENTKRLIVILSKVGSHCCGNAIHVLIVWPGLSRGLPFVVRSSKVRRIRAGVKGHASELRRPPGIPGKGED